MEFRVRCQGMLVGFVMDKTALEYIGTHAKSGG
jgi:hypothetical protein